MVATLSSPSTERKTQVRSWARPLQATLKYLHEHRLGFYTVVDSQAWFSLPHLRESVVNIPEGIQTPDGIPFSRISRSAYAVCYDHNQAFNTVMRRWFESDECFDLYMIDKYRTAHFMRIEGDMLAPTFEHYDPIIETCMCAHGQCPVRYATAYHQQY